MHLQFSKFFRGRLYPGPPLKKERMGADGSAGEGREEDKRRGKRTREERIGRIGPTYHECHVTPLPIHKLKPHYTDLL
jgi:hypothetical protein